MMKGNTIARITGLTCLLLQVWCSLSGQSEPVYSQYMYDKVLVNPAYAGSSRWIFGSVKYRNHLYGLEGAPSTSLFTFHMPIQKKSMGTGVKVVWDQIAVTNSLQMSFLYSYHIGFGNGKLSFGLEGGMIRRTAGFQDLIRYHQIDPSIPEEQAIAMVPDFSTGLFYQSENYYAGVAAYHLLNPKKTGALGGTGHVFDLEQTYYFLGGYIFELSRTFSLEPSTLVKFMQPEQIQADINVNLIYNDRIIFGGSYRLGNFAALMCKFNITEGLRVAYSYDLNISNLSSYSSGSHEVMISYGVKLLPPPEKKEIHPRYYF